MEITLGHADNVRNECKDIRTKDLTFEHLTAHAQAVMRAFGNQAVLWRGNIYVAIIPPRTVEQQREIETPERPAVDLNQRIADAQA